MRILFEKYISDLRREMLAQKTIYSREVFLKNFLDELHVDYHQITLELIEKYQDRMLLKGLKPKTYKGYCIMIRQFVRWLNDEGVTSINIAKMRMPKRVPETEVNYLEIDEVKQLFQLLTPNQQKDSLRDYALFLSLYSTGCRISELLSLNRENINYNTGQAQVIGKGGKLRAVYFSEPALNAIRAYLKRRTDGCRPLFISHSNRGNNQRLARYTVEKKLRKLCKTLGFTKKVTPHTIRRTFATLFIRNGGQIVDVSALLGHSNLRVTHRYVIPANNQLKTAHQNYLPDPAKV